MDSFNLPPDVVAQLMQMGGLNRQDELLQQQLAQAEALRGQRPNQGYGLMGGIGAGLSNAFNGIHAALETRDTRQGLKGNAGQENDVAKQIAQAMLLRGQQAPAQSDSVPPFLARDSGGY